MIQRITLLALMTLLATGSASDPVTGPAGVYTVTTAGPTRVTSGEGWVKIEWEIEKVPPPPEPAKPDPPPTVTPPPAPAPPPTPTVSIPTLTGQVWMLAVYDGLTAGYYPPGQLAVLLPADKGGSPTIGPALKALQISWQPHNTTDPVVKTWVADAIVKGLPALVVIGNAGKTSFVVPLPVDEAGVLALAKKIRGQ